MAAVTKSKGNLRLVPGYVLVAIAVAWSALLERVSNKWGNKGDKTKNKITTEKENKEIRQFGA